MSDLGILPNPIPFGKYYLLERVNVGGMAEIFKAKAFGVEGFERLLAVKKILANIAEDESFIKMFIDEAKIAGQLNHPNIAQIFDLGKADGSFFIALEYISGKDLKTIFERSRRIGEKVSIPRICYVMMKVCEGLGHAHTKKDAQGHDLNIVHRDVSPQNVLLSYEGECKIIDFGIAKAQGKTSQTQVGTIKGKFSYMSPEQVRGLHVDRRSDIFSLGIVLYEMLTLERLFLGENDFDTLEKIRKVEMSPPSLYNPHIPSELENIVLKALAKSPEERFQSSSEFADALEQFMRHHGYYYNHKDLAVYMKESFEADIEYEAKKFEYYRSLNLLPPAERPPNGAAKGGGRGAHPMAGLSWGEDEQETQIFDRVVEMNGTIESIIDADIVYTEDVDAVHGSGMSLDGTAADFDPPTVEYDRDAMRKELSEFEQGGPPPIQERPRYAPTSQLPSIEPRRDTLVTVQGSVPAPGRPRRGLSPLTILGVGGLVVAAGLALLYVIWDWPAEVAFRIEPSDVRISVDGVEVFDGETPYTYKITPGVHTIEIASQGYEPVLIKQEFQKSMAYEIDKALETSNPLFTLSVSPEDVSVEINGTPYDQGTPLTLTDFPAGSVLDVVVTKKGFNTFSKKETLGEDPSTMTVALEPVTYTLSVDSAPQGASFELRDQTGKVVKSDKTPSIVEALVGSTTYTALFEKHGYDSKELSLGLWDSEERRLKAPLITSLEEEETPQVASTTKARPTPAPTVRRNPPKRPPVVATKTPAPSDPPPQKDPPKSKKKGTATLTIASKPVARVYIDGKDTGRFTPLLNYKVDTDDHKIELVNKDFNLRKTYYVKDLEPGESRRIINRPK